MYGDNGCIVCGAAGGRRVITLPAVGKTLSIEMMKIPAGEFIYTFRNKRHYLPEFEIMKYPVTVGQFKTFLSANPGYKYPQMRQNNFPWGWQENHPMRELYWSEAADFAAWAGMSLPTDAEWEKAARGTDGRKYPWGDDWDGSRCANAVSGSPSQNMQSYNAEPVSVAEVGRFPEGASPYGVFDMAGNVWEFCEQKHVLKGGSGFQRSKEDFTTYKVLPDFKTNVDRRRVGYGFRCVIRSKGR